MGWFDDEDESEAGAPKEPAGPPVSAAKDPVVRDYLMKKYAQAADDADVRQAREDADDTTRNMGIMTGIGQMLTAKGKSRGGAGFDDSVFKSLAANARHKVGDAQQARQDRMNSVLTEDKLQQQGVERDREGEKHGWEKDDQLFKGKERQWKSDENDPNSPVAASTRKILSNQYGIPTSQMEGMSFAQLKGLNLKAREAKTKGYQLKAVETPQGTIEWFNFDPDTGSMSPTGNKAGYKAAFDSTTGTQFSGATIGGPATPVTAPGGGELSVLRTDLEGERAGVKATATQGVKNEQAATEASAKAGTRQALANKWLGLHKSAYSSDGAGPVWAVCLRD